MTPTNDRQPLGSLVGNGSNHNNKHNHTLHKDGNKNTSSPKNVASSPRNNPFVSKSISPRAARESAPDGFVKPTSRPSHFLTLSTRRLTRDRTSAGIMSADIEVGDTVAVPGGMTGVVRFIGPVEGKSGVFAGVELSKEYASMGKNNGDVEGVRYFTTSVPGAGIFLPSHRATKQASPTSTSSTFPPTPTTPSMPNTTGGNSRRTTTSAAAGQTPPTPSIPKFSQSVGPGARHPFIQTVGPGARAPSPQLKPKSRPSLPRPESPSRNQPKLQATPGRPSLRSMRPAGSPAAKPSTPATSTSRSLSRQSHVEQSPDPEDTPTARTRPSISSTSRTNSQSIPDQSAEISRYQYKLEERDRQLKEQAASLAEMESSLAELQSLVAANAAAQKSAQAMSPGEAGGDLSDVNQLRALLREKNEEIQMLTAEFDSHRADFRSTIDTLEMASTETERVYEKRVQELLQEVEELQGGREDVATVAAQLKALEDLVQELEEGLEDARRGEAEAKSEVEFLRGEIERARLELRREREKAAKALKGAGAAVGDSNSAGSPSNGSRDLEQRDDEIRGLKAIIHSLSSGAEVGSPAPEAKTNGISANGQGKHSSADKAFGEEFAQLKESVAILQREKSELQGLVDRKNYREDELERELARLRSLDDGNNGVHSKTDSGSTATMHTANRISNSSATTAFRPGSTSYSSMTVPSTQNRLSRNSGSGSGSRPTSTRLGSASAVPTTDDDATTQDRKYESFEAVQEVASTTDSASVSAPDTDSVWCELCETSGHDILTCSRMFGEAGSKDADSKAAATAENNGEQPPELTRTVTAIQTSANDNNKDEVSAKRESADVPSASFYDAKEERGTPEQPASAVPDGAAAGKNSGKVDMSKWCAMCEKDGHESVDCPFEDDYY